ncbi:hypothetical protein CRG98_000682 [Punica granatum]|uniref:Uncharacterized protein n=1 Tax=Punica granatum TaxID=22663 RepID=A0A2I0LE18_PUNGR|nr:hypothetical protein CRG98_000682 [Punica granatum]
MSQPRGYDRFDLPNRQDPAPKPNNNAQKTPQAARVAKEMKQIPSKPSRALDPTRTSDIIPVDKKPSVEDSTHQESNSLVLMEASTVGEMQDSGAVALMQLRDGGGDALPLSKADCRIVQPGCNSRGGVLSSRATTGFSRDWIALSAIRSGVFSFRSRLHVLPRVKSDHHPLRLYLQGNQGR